MLNPKRLVDIGLCASFAEARRLISDLNETKSLHKIQEKEREKWGRKLIRVSGST